MTGICHARDSGRTPSEEELKTLDQRYRTKSQHEPTDEQK